MLKYKCYSFDELSNIQLYRVMQLRIEVFSVEQNCPYQDADNKDQDSYHILGVDAKGVLQAYTRIVPPGLSYKVYSSIGRVITSAAVRGKKQGIPLMNFSIEKTLEFWPKADIKISAQTYITKFYNSLGFQEIGEEYLEDDLPHIAMIRKTEQ